MSKNLKDLFVFLRDVDLPVDLEQSVFCVIKEEKKRKTRIKIYFFSFISLTSFISVFPIFSLISESLSKSGFYDYISLIYSSDIVILASYWQDFILSLAESVPYVSIALFLSIISAFLWSSNQMFKNFRNAFEVGQIA